MFVITAHSTDIAWPAIAAVVATIYDSHSELTTVDVELPKNGDSGRAISTTSTSEED